MLLDASGRRTMSLHVGANSIRHLAAGVYFLTGLTPDGLPRRFLLVR
jgi:hypothetical protein